MDSYQQLGKRGPSLHNHQWQAVVTLHKLAAYPVMLRSAGGSSHTCSASINRGAA